MGAPAARVGDATSHGTPLGPGPGSATVLIEGRPAWRATVDWHLCPRAEGAIPHVGGAVPMGSATVSIAGQPAVRQGDMVVEAVSANPIVGGAATVTIG